MSIVQKINKNKLKFKIIKIEEMEVSEKII